jgi:hypothetical protein
MTLAVAATAIDLADSGLLRGAQRSCAARGGRTSPRKPPADAGVPDRHIGGSCSNEASYALADRLTVELGHHSAVVQRYLASLSVAPLEHLELLSANQTAIVFGPTIVLALDSPWATSRRSAPLTRGERAYHAREDSQAAGTVAIYDAKTNALVFPTSYVASAEELEDVVVHELGHALTWRAANSVAHSRGDLLIDLPKHIHRHVFSDAYRVHGNERETARMRVHEALAEGYVWLTANRADELPAQLTSDLISILDGNVLQGRRRLSDGVRCQPGADDHP